MLLADYFNDEDIDIFLHIDRRAAYSVDVARGIKEEFPRVNVYRKFKVRWGGFSILRAELFMLAEAMSTGDYGYVHFLSGEDFPLRPLSFFKEFFENFSGKEFMEYHPFPTPKWNGGSAERLEQWWPNDLFDINTPAKINRMRAFIAWQRRKGIIRKMPRHFSRLYGGSNWMSVTGDCARYVSGYVSQNKKWLNRLRFTFASDEICLPTIIMNSPYSESVTNNNLRYIDWSMGLPSPAFMTERHIEPAMRSEALFARKVGVGISDTFCEAIARRRCLQGRPEHG